MTETRPKTKPRQSIRPVRPNKLADFELKLCTAYLYRRDGCDNGETCNSLHVCRNYMLQSCKARGSCHFSHDLQSSQSQALFQRRFGINRLEGKKLQEFKELFAATIRSPALKDDSGEGSFKEQRDENRQRNFENLSHFLKNITKAEAMSSQETQETTANCDGKEDKKQDKDGQGGEQEEKSRDMKPSKEATRLHSQPHKGKQPEICFFYLHGSCKFSSDVHQNFRHYQSPFQWQIQDDRFGWLDLTRQSNEHVEEHYCDVSNIEYSGPILACSGKHRDSVFHVVRIAFGADNFKVSDNSGQALAVRRLCTPSYAQVGGWRKAYSTHWIWYWQHSQKTWNEYPKQVDGSSIINGTMIERKYLNFKNKHGPSQLEIPMELGKWCLDFSCMEETSLVRGEVQVQAVARRPKWQSPQEKCRGVDQSPAVRLAAGISTQTAQRKELRKLVTQPEIPTTQDHHLNEVVTQPDKPKAKDHQPEELVTPSEKPKLQDCQPNELVTHLERPKAQNRQPKELVPHSEKPKPNDCQPKESVTPSDILKPHDRRPKGLVTPSDILKPHDRKPKELVTSSDKRKPQDRQPKESVTHPEKLEAENRQPKEFVTQSSEKPKPKDLQRKGLITHLEKPKAKDRQPKELVTFSDKPKPQDPQPKELVTNSEKQQAQDRQPKVLVSDSDKLQAEDQKPGELVTQPKQSNIQVHCLEELVTQPEKPKLQVPYDKRLVIPATQNSNYKEGKPQTRCSEELEMQGSPHFKTPQFKFPLSEDRDITILREAEKLKTTQSISKEPEKGKVSIFKISVGRVLDTEPEASVRFHFKNQEDLSEEPSIHIHDQDDKPWAVKPEPSTQAVRPKTRNPSGVAEVSSSSPDTLSYGSGTSCNPERKEFVYICPYFLRGSCRYDDNKYSHKRHFPRPYQWQFLDTKSRGTDWVNIPLAANDDVEKAYCDVNMDYFPVPRTSVVSDLYIFFNEMHGTTPDIHIRRLSTSTSITRNNWEKAFCTEWIWYWRDERHEWISYSDKNTLGIQAGIDSATIEQRYLEFESKDGESVIDFTAGTQRYKLDFTAKEQTNMLYGTRRPVRRRPKFVPMDERKRLSRELSQVKSIDVAVPATWENMDAQADFQLVPLTIYTSPEYILIANLFWDTMDKVGSIICIERIQNLELWEDFSKMSERMKKKNGGKAVLQKQLFHGTTSRTFADAICRQNFDWRLSGSNVGTRYGKGSYFARDAKFAHIYTEADNNNHCYVFVVQALVGTYTTGDSKYTRPPPIDSRDPHGKMYDSCVNDVADPGIFVIFEKTQVYPEYLIKYKEKPSYEMAAIPNAGSSLSYKAQQPAAHKPQFSPLVSATSFTPLQSVPINTASIMPRQSPAPVAGSRSSYWQAGSNSRYSTASASSQILQSAVSQNKPTPSQQKSQKEKTCSIQ